MPQLDGLRAFAVGGVLVAHYLPKVNSVIETGGLGVRLFFVLSGYLITKLLLESRLRVEQGRGTFRAQIRRFYVRRLFRLFPALLTLVALSVIFRAEPIHSTFLWHLTYLSNVYQARLGEWSGSASHLWSLSVEEQFYLCWPFLILLSNRRNIVPLIVVMILAGLGYRAVSTLAGANTLVIETMPFACLDSLGMGALLAVSESASFTAIPDVRRLCGLSLRAGLLGALALFLCSRLHLVPVAVRVARETVWSLLFLWLVGRASVGFRGAAGRVLENRGVVYLGSISYGIYLYHEAAPAVANASFAALNLPHPTEIFPASNAAAAMLHANAVIAFAANVSVALAMAMVSWLIVERPALGLRRRFENTSSAPAVAPIPG